MATVGHTLARSKLLLILSLLAALALAWFASQLPTAQAAPVTPLPPGHTWEYTFTDPTGDPAWNTTGVWGTSALGAAPFATPGGPC
jgi:lipopolysaccharide export system protein LptC